MLKIWGEIKAAETKAKRKKDAGLLGGVPRALPALVEAQQIASRARRRRLRLGECRAGARQAPRGARRVRRGAPQRASQDELEDELGDMLFVLVNLARFVKVDPEQALRRTNAKFRRASATSSEARRAAAEQPEEATIEEMEALWQEAKRRA